MVSSVTVICNVIASLHSGEIITNILLIIRFQIHRRRAFIDRDEAEVNTNDGEKFGTES